MTRLVTKDIEQVVVKLRKYDESVKKMIGASLLEIAMHAVDLKAVQKDYKTAVIPVTSGLGIIDQFSDTVCGILKFCGIDAFVTSATDVAGIQEAYKEGAQIIFMADDDICSAFAIEGTRVYSDNSYATGVGFAAVLELAMKKKKQMEPVLVLGAGPVGTAATKYLDQQGIEVKLYDIEEEKAKQAVNGLSKASCLAADEKKGSFRYALDATPVAGVFGKDLPCDEMLLSAPGMPLGVDEVTRKRINVFHNPLELGIITMYFDCVKQMEAGCYGNKIREERTKTVCL